MRLFRRSFEAFSWGRSVLAKRWARRDLLVGEVAAIERSRKRLLDAIDILPQGIVILDEDYKYVAWNKAYTDMYPRTADFIIAGESLENAIRAGLARGDYPEAKGCEQKWLANRLAKLKTPTTRHEQRLSNGRWTMIEDRHMPDGSVVSLRVDITEMKAREESFRLLFENNPVPMFVCDPESWAVRTANLAAIGHYGYSAEQLKSMTFNDVHSAVDLRAREALANRDTLAAHGRSYQHVCSDGRIIEVEVRASELLFEGEPAILLTCIDITDRRINELRVLHLSRHDPLTNLPNRLLLNETLHTALNGRDPFALVFLDLDRFKLVNDTLGHVIGDELLVHVARRLKSCVRPNDLVARLGGDEFAIVLFGSLEHADVEATGARIIKSLNQPFIISEREISVGVSIGVAVSGDAVNAAEFVRISDLAMYAAKAAGRNTMRFFEPGMCEVAVARAELESHLRLALSRNEFEVHYQPIVDLETGIEQCREALVRWRHPEKGLVPPIQFIPMAEEMGLIHDLSTIVMRQSCLDAKTWPEHIKVSVNVSAVELSDEAILDRVRRSLAHANLAPNRLQIEVTETAVMNNFELATQLLKQIRAMGVEIVMDDFGTGYSSLSFLRVAPIDKLKIDRSFVRDLETSSGRTVLTSILEMANALGIRTTGEGVETPEQAKVLKDLKCGEAQGYYFGRPKPQDSGGKDGAAEATIAA